MRTRGDFWDVMANVMALCALWAFCVFVLGAAARVTKVLFCLGFGC